MREKRKRACRLILLIAFAAAVGAISASIMTYADSGTEPEERPTNGISRYPTSSIEPSEPKASKPTDIETEEAEIYTVGDAANEVTEADIDLLARLITSEQGYATSYEIGSAKRDTILENYYLCGSVVINRVRSDLFPDTLGGVIYQSGQYDVVRTGAINCDYDDIAWEIAEELLTYGTDIPEDVVFQAQFTQGSSVYAHVGNQYYCRR